MIKPQEIDQFWSVFRNAKLIRAYNPPLTLLTNPNDARHRQVIYQVLLNNPASYRLLAGSKSIQRLPDLYRLWTTERPRREWKQALENMRVIHYEHKADLHTEISEWGELGHDLRGLSFFLIEHHHGEEVVLLYLLGDPFVEKFEVPNMAIEISGFSSNNQMYDKLVDMFDRRWDTLNAYGNPNLREKSIARFCENRNEIHGE